MRERLASPPSAYSRRIKSKTSSARCGRSNTMAPTQPTQRLFPSQAISAAACGHSNSGFTLVRIPAGSFLMGCDTGQDNETPVHRVWVDEFLLAAHQVTNADYDRFLRDAACPPPPPPFWNDPAFNHPEQPVVGVSWHEAIRYCEWLSANISGKFRLPTEAEWERAARGSSEGTLYPWGDAPPQSLPGYASRCAGHWQTGPEPVGRAESNAYGLYNMCDNVHEWCSDWYAPEYYAVSPERNPRGPETGERRASRGGCRRHHVKMPRRAARPRLPPDVTHAGSGFRASRDAQSAGGGYRGGCRGRTPALVGAGMVSRVFRARLAPARRCATHHHHPPGAAHRHAGPQPRARPLCATHRTNRLPRQTPARFTMAHANHSSG